MDFLVTLNDLVLMASLGEGEIRDAIIEVRCFEINEARQPAITIKDILGSKVAV